MVSRHCDQHLKAFPVNLNFLIKKRALKTHFLLKKEKLKKKGCIKFSIHYLFILFFT